VNVAWTDRSNQLQSVRLTTAITGIAPELAGSLSLPMNSGAMRQVNGRSPAIPLAAKNFGDGTSGFVPPQPAGPQVAWVFSNVTGLIERTCTVAESTTSSSLTAPDVAANLTTCTSNQSAQMISGFVNFANTAVQPNQAQAEAPTGTPLNLNISLTLTSNNHPSPGWDCYDDAPLVAVSVTRPVAYFCAIYTNPERRWSGRLRVQPQAFISAGSLPWTTGTQDTSDASQRVVCRYTTLSNDGGAADRNSAHPLDYRLAGMPPGATLRDQNFLVIKGPHSCPVDSVPDPVNSSTSVHQNGVTPYL
jgi:hypothetical protein